MTEDPKSLGGEWGGSTSMTVTTAMTTTTKPAMKTTTVFYYRSLRECVLCHAVPLSCPRTVAAATAADDDDAVVLIVADACSVVYACLSLSVCLFVCPLVHLTRKACCRRPWHACVVVDCAGRHRRDRQAGWPMWRSLDGFSTTTLISVVVRLLLSSSEQHQYPYNQTATSFYNSKRLMYPYSWLYWH